jgi:hypothetical protein
LIVRTARELEKVQAQLQTTYIRCVGVVRVEERCTAVIVRKEENNYTNNGGIMPNEEIAIEVSYLKRFNLGNYQHKEYLIKLSGTEAQIEAGFAERKAKLQNYLQDMEQLVEGAHEANTAKG